MTDEHGTLDFETYSEAAFVWDAAAQKWRSPPGYANTKRGLPVCGADRYVSHPTFCPLSLAFDLHDGRGVERVEFRKRGHAYPCPPRLALHVMRGGKLEAWNVGFEHLVWEWCVKHWGWPAWPLEQQLCAMAKSRAAAYPGSLEEAAAVLGSTQQKDKIGGRLVRKLTVPRNPTKTNPALFWTPDTAPHDFEAFYAYNEQDVRAETEVSARLPPLSPYEFRVWTLDQRINRRGVGIDRAAVENCIAIFEQAIARGNAELCTITNGAVESYTEVSAMVAWLRNQGFYVHELDEEIITEALKRSDLPAGVARVLRLRQALAFGSVKKLYAMREQTGLDGRLRNQYDFHGAHTSLWNGRGAQLANLPRPMHDAFEKPHEVERALQVIATRSIEALDAEYGPGSEFAKRTGASCDPLEVVASCLRSMIVAAPGYRLISADFNAIQAVVTSCIAGEEWRIKVFETHGKIYEAMGARLSGLTLDEVLEYKKRTGKHHPCRQNPGKLAVLSGDFGAWINGWKRFGADKLLGSDENIKAAILKTRDAQPMISALWGGQTINRFSRDPENPEQRRLYGLEGAAVAALENPGVAYDYRGIIFQKHGATLYCQTLDGGYLRYHNAELHPSQRPYARSWEYEITYEGHNSNATKGAPGWQTMSLYGGVLTQNVVSRMSRIVQADALLRLEEHGYPVVMHTHDENVTEVPVGSHHTAAEHTRLTGTLPPWAKLGDGRPWPIRVPDSWEQPRYGKW